MILSSAPMSVWLIPCDVLQRTLARSGKDHAIDPRALQVLAEAFGVAPLAGVVDQQGVLDAVLGVVDRRRVVGVDHLDQVAVGGQRVVFFVDGDGAVERTAPSPDAAGWPA